MTWPTSGTLCVLLAVGGALLLVACGADPLGRPAGEPLLRAVVLHDGATVEVDRP